MNQLKPIWIFEQHISFSIEAIEKIVFEIKEGRYESLDLPFLLRDKKAFSVKKEGSKIAVQFDDGHKEFIFLNPSEHQFSMQGEWWYRGVYQLERTDEGTRIRLQVFNVAQKFRWAAALMILREKKTHRLKFEKFTGALEAAKY
jgi:hypothetical protein